MCHFAFFFLNFGLLLRCVFGPLNFWTIFALLEALKMTVHLGTGVFNVSAFVQISIILNFKWTEKFRDRTVIISAICASCAFLATNFIDHILVGKFEFR